MFLEMKITFLGVGSAFTRKNFHTSALVEVVGLSGTPLRMLIDCGRTVPEAMRDAGYDWKDIDAVYVTHLHSDHVGGLEDMAFFNFFVTKRKPMLFGNEMLLQDLWTHSLQGGLASIEGQICTLDTYFNVVAVPINGSFRFADVEFTPVQTVHIMNGYGVVPSFGLLWRTKQGKSVFFTGDTQYCPHQIKRFYEQADIIFHDAEIYRWKENDAKSGVHAHYNDLKLLPAETKAKMWLMHYNDAELPDAKADGFAGFVERKQVFEI